MTAGVPRAWASLTAWAMIFWMSDSDRNEFALAQKPLQPESGVVCGGGGEVPALLVELLPPLHALSMTMAASDSQTNLVFFPIALLPKRESPSRRTPIRRA